MAAAALAATLTGSPASGLMYDVVEPTKLPPTECGEAGCMRWDGGSAARSDWRDPTRMAAAGKSCAQPGNAVNTHPYGAWCICDNATSTESAGAPTFNLESSRTDKERGMWLSFSYDSVVLYPASATDGRGVWQFVAATGVGSTVYIVNQWHAPTDRRAGMYLSFSGTGIMLSGKTDTANRVPWKIVDTGSGDGTVYLQNQWRPTDHRYGMYAGYNDGSTAMILVPEADVAERAAVWTLVKAAPVQISGYCVSPKGVPEQINLQLASADTLVASWVTFEAEDPRAPPTVTLTGPRSASRSIPGFTHRYVTRAGRVFFMHFVALRGLEPRGQYSYAVQSGGAGVAKSSTFSFRAPPDATTPTRLAMYGDLGVYEWNSMENLRADCNGDPSGSVADAIVHMGDHAYNEGDNDEIRADAYMNAFQPILSECPWMPVVGNHEYSGMQLARYLNSTWQKWAPLPLGGEGGPTLTAADAKLFHSTATSALGFFLSAGNLHAAGSAGRLVTAADGSSGSAGAAAQPSASADQPHPSNTSRYFSADVGLVHLIGLDFNLYYGSDACGDRCKEAQLAWFEEDLKMAVANRNRVPWIIAMSHFPVFCTGCAGNGVDSSYYASYAAERFGNANASAAAEFEARIRSGNGDNTTAWAAAGDSKLTSKGASDNLVTDVAPLLKKYGVDLFMAGHWHYYESLWPGTGGSESCMACLEPTQKDFHNPKGTVHITTGNGGPPGLDSFHEHCPGEDCDKIAATRVQSLAFGYGRLVAYNATTLEWTQFNNSDSSVVDNFVIQQSNHGPF